MGHIIGWSAIVVLGVILVVNGAFMLFSPKAWFRLPHWIGKQGSLTEEKYGSGWGAFQIRVGGALFLALVAWVLYDSLFGRR